MNLFTGSSSEILELQLPDKLLVDKKDAGLEKNRDFKIISAGYAQTSEIDKVQYSYFLLIMICIMYSTSTGTVLQRLLMN